MADSENRAVLVTVSGKSRTGKDTLINGAITHLRGVSIPGSGVMDITHVSSIELVRTFWRNALIEINRPMGVEPSSVDRQALFEIKSILDRLADYTCLLGVRKVQWRLTHSWLTDRIVVFYQVREVANLAALQSAISREPGMQMRSLYVMRDGPRPADVTAAESDHVESSDFKFDWVLTTHHPAKPDAAIYLADQIKKVVGL